MKLLYILATILSTLNHINRVLMTNQSNLKIFERSKSENVQDAHNTQYNSLINTTDVESTLQSYKFCKYEEYLHKFISNGNETQMIWVTWNRTKIGESAVLPSICSVDNGLPLQRRCHNFEATSKWEQYNKHTILLDCQASMFCQPEVFDHYVLDNNGALKEHRNAWKRTKIGEYSNLRDLCLLPSGLHVTRKCYYDMQRHTAAWVNVDHLKGLKCMQHIRQQVITKELNRLHENTTTLAISSQDMKTRRQACLTLLSLLERPKTTLLPGDIQLTSSILKNILTGYQGIELSADVLKITYNLMSPKSNILRMSAELNATNILLEVFENYMDGITQNLVSKRFCKLKLPAANLRVSDDNDTSVEIINLSHIGVFAQIGRNISVFFVNPSCSLISGIAIYDSYQPDKNMTQQGNQIRYNSLNDLYYRFIFMNESIHNLLRENHLVLASYIPTHLWILLLDSSKNSFLDAPVVVFKIYAHDNLFIERKLIRSRKPFSKILSISLPGLTDKLEEPLPFILRSESAENNLNSNSNTGCGYWNYGSWISTGVYTNASQLATANGLILCSTNHLTQFTYLLAGNYLQNDLSDEVFVTSAHQKALDIISMTGCSLSLLGLVGIWTTALLFESWRSQASNKVLLNMCAALTLQMVLFLFVNTDNISEALVESHSYTKCVLLGAVLQYSLLVLFTWMLIVALLQYQRYVTVIGIQRPAHYLMKSAVVAWTLPLIPTLLVVLLDSKSYIPKTFELATHTGVCYPSGNGLHFGVTLPVSLVVLVNLTIFVHVFYSISHTLSTSMQRHEKQMIVKQIRLSILLFFLLGLSWIFGLLAFLSPTIIFSYLFCLTATLQGFVLFIYFVILDDTAQSSWRKILCSSRFKKTTPKKSAELQSMTTTTTSAGYDNTSSRDH